MVNLLRDPIWQGVGVIITLILGLLGFYYVGRNKIWLYASVGVAVFLVGLGIGTQLIPQANPTIEKQESLVHIDFEDPDEQQRWMSTDISFVTRSAEYTFNGNFALAISTKGTPDGNHVLAEWNRPFRADIILGRVYWPERSDVNVIWAQFCIIGVGACNDFAVTSGQWNAFSVNLYNDHLTDRYDGLYLQADIQVTDPAQAYTFYVDGLELYTSLEKP